MASTPNLAIPIKAFVPASVLPENLSEFSMVADLKVSVTGTIRLENKEDEQDTLKPIRLQLPVENVDCVVVGTCEVFISPITFTEEGGYTPNS